ncbi:MAG: hypothetical protein IKB12_07610 [Clostridia bacterium]|nr:hypothetical protein [Clostridia bacterium]
MKKLVCILVSLVMIFSVTGLAFAEKEQKNETPIIIIPGFMQTNLQYENEDSTFEKVWAPDFLGKLGIVGQNLPDILKSALEIFNDNTEALGEALMDMMSDLMPKMMCNPDGTSVYKVLPYENDPAKRNMHHIKHSGEEYHMQGYYTFASYICDEGYAKEENVFIFEYDSRFDAITNAESLREFVKAVKAYTGKDKVSLIGVSYGGQIEAAYLHMFMDDNDIEKAVFNVPALLGTNFGDRLLNARVEFALDDIVALIEHMSASDTELSTLLKDADPEFFSRLLNGLSAGISEYARYWSSVYSLTSVEYYEQLKEKYLDPVASAEIIKRNDIIHYEIMPKMKETLNECLDRGIYIAIHAGSGLDLVLGGDENADLLLPTEKVTGAVCAPRGKRFSDGFTGAGTECKNPEHHHVSPSMEIDASTAFLPENTWFVEGTPHAMFQFDSYGLELAAKALCTDELKDVHSDPEFPQFMTSKNVNFGVFAKFNESAPGYITKKDSSIIIENLFENNKIKVLSVKAKGLDISFDSESKKILSPGEQIEISFNGEIPNKNAVRAAVTVKYIKYDIISSVAERTFDLTVLDGEKGESDGSIVDNEYYIKNSSGMNIIKKALTIVGNLFDLIFVLSEFLTGDAFRYLL